MGLAVGMDPGSMELGRPRFSRWVVVTAVGSIVHAGGAGSEVVGLGGAFLWMSSIRFTFDVLDLVFMVGARDGETGGEGESSPTITGIDRVVWLAVLLALQAEVWGMLRVGGVPPYSSTRDSESSSCSVSGIGVRVGWGYGRWALTRSASFGSLGLIGGGFDVFGSWVHGVGGGAVGRHVGRGFFGIFYNVSVRGTGHSCVSSVGGSVVVVPSSRTYSAYWVREIVFPFHWWSHYVRFHYCSLLLGGVLSGGGPFSFRCLSVVGASLLSSQTVVGGVLGGQSGLTCRALSRVTELVGVVVFVPSPLEFLFVGC